MAEGDIRGQLNNKSDDDLRRIAELLEEIRRTLVEDRRDRKEDKEKQKREAESAASVVAGVSKDLDPGAARLIAQAEAGLTARSKGFANADDWARSQGYGGGWNEMYAEQMRNARGAGSGFTGVFNRITGYQFATGTGNTSALYGIEQSMKQGGFIGKTYKFGEALSAAFTPNYASNALAMSLSDRERAALLYTDRRATTDVALANIDPATLNQAERRAFSKLADPSTTYRERGKAISTLQEKILASGNDITALKESSNPVVRQLAKGITPAAEGFAGTMAGAGELMMMGARFAGPVAAAITAAQSVYNFTKDTVYAPNRAAAGLGYGFSNNPFDSLTIGTGANVALKRSIQTKMDALFSMGLSGAQTAAARGAIEGMGLGGRGSEGMYNAFYGSMTDVIQNTQLDANQIAPIYEDFFRSGGTEKEVSRLTKLLKDDLPKAAAASRMSLGQMVDSINKIVDAAAKTPLNARTRTELREDAVRLAQAGGFKSQGLAAMASGLNEFVATKAAMDYGIDYRLVKQNPGMLLETGVGVVRQQLGDMSIEEFDRKRRTDPAFITQLSTTASMLGLEVDDIRNLYSVGLTDYINAGRLSEVFQGKERKAKDKVVYGEHKYRDLEDLIVSRSLGLRQTEGADSRWIREHLGFDINFGYYKQTTEGHRYVTDQSINSGKEIDLSTTSAHRLTGLYKDQIDVLRSGVETSGGNLSSFNKKIKALQADTSAGSAEEAYDYFKSVQQHLEDRLQKSGDQTKVIIEPTADLARLLKLRFGSKYADPNAANTQVSQGGVAISNGASD